MITVVSEEQDIMTDLTLEWLVHNEVPVRRVQDHTLQAFSVIIDNTGNTGVDQSAETYWTRRGRENYLPPAIDHSIPENLPVYRYLEHDELVVSNYQEHQRKQQLRDKCVGSFFAEKDNNKLINLELAKLAGFLIPPTCITNCKSVLSRFIQTHKQVITKDLRAPVHLPARGGILSSSGVISIERKDVEGLADNFAPIFAQQNIAKQFEIRSFVFQKSVFSMAIFSQNDAQTTTDFRNYNEAKPNRCVPFQLPVSVERKLLSFMELAELDTGSADLIYTPEDKYVFLEVNPMGQLHWLSENCNYYLEQFIADQLSKS